MNMVKINSIQCNKDGICAAECPVGIIELNAESGTPMIKAESEETCIDCGHCVAVCPTGALSHRSMTPEQCIPVDTSLFVAPEQLEHLLKSRRSIRSYRNKAVPLKDISKLIDIARYAPSGHNTQGVKWHVVYDQKKIKPLSAMVVDWMKNMAEKQPKMAQTMGLNRIIDGFEMGRDFILRDAPHVVIAYAPTQDSTAQSAATIALTYLELAAFSLNIGACWAGYLQIAAGFWPPLQDAIELPKAHKCHGAMMIGYPKYTYHRQPVRKKPDIRWR